MDEKLESAFKLLNNVDKKIARVGYKYQSIEDFAKIDNVEELQLVYWSEMIQRYHFSCATTLLRLKKWYQSLFISYSSENYYSFCTSLRGLIEACSDSFYLLGRVMYSIAENIQHINVAVSGKAKKIVLSEETEDELIHYMYARKLNKKERGENPDSHNVKQVSKYLENMKSEKLNQLYSELCQVSHPSMMSLNPFVWSTDEHAIILHDENVDSALNENLIKRYAETIYDASMLAILPALSGLRIINQINADLLSSLRTEPSAFKCLDGSELWLSIESKLKG
ncbi:hypothetical protein AB6C72_23615 [Vibrio splendidus]|uniref:hypothetical protein n=1 Tax=Vibrio splendidus TaxID=29497 RepID=UPI0024693E5F|nr:hypothetical protein [Vibrio splendidus]MDH5978543.1 hypothetical protein [Vibrio splendidus]